MEREDLLAKFEDRLKVIDLITRYIKDYVELAGGQGVVLGASGGVDSSTLIPLAINALGREKVRLIMMPCESNPQDLEDALAVAKKFNAKYMVVNLESTYKELVKNIVEPTDLTKGNIKARLRMTTLYAFANQLGYFNMGTGNKSELAIGYITKYGDGGVDFEPLASLYKGEIYELANELNIPEQIIQKAPSAGLWKDQTDEAEIGMSYAELDNILKLINHKDMHHFLATGPAFEILMQRYRAAPDQVKEVLTLIRKNAHKSSAPSCFSRNHILSILAK